jgi:V8-like Glu-specific endopeptidase
MKLTIKTLILALLSTLLLPFAPVYAIYNGTDAAGTPNVVTVIKEYSDGKRYASCSGALVAPRVVVTAAHCVTEDETGLLAKNVWVAPAGATWKIVTVDGKSGRILENEQYKAASIKVTSTYYSTSDIVEDNDVAFIVLEKALPLTSNIAIASDEETESFIANKSLARIYGYGLTIFDGDMALKPKTATMNFDFKSSTVKNSVFLKSASAGACPGDSGGPVIVSTPTKLYLVGVITGGTFSKVGPECNAKISGNYYTLVTLITKYANLAFASAVEASNKSDSALFQSEIDLKIARDSLIESDMVAKTAVEIQLKSDAELKIALSAKEKSETDAQLAREAKTKSDTDAAAALRISIEAELKARLADEAKLAAENSASALRNEIATLNSNIKALQSSLSAASKKLTAICKVKPKPKGC